MKLFVFVLLIPFSLALADILVPEGGGSASEPIYNEAGWDISSSPNAMTVMSRCQGDHCPQVILARMPTVSEKTYNFVLTKKEMTSYEIASRLGYSEQYEPQGFRAVVLILNEIKESQSRGESKSNFIQRQLNYISSSENLQLRLLKAKVMADIAYRISPK